jgi:hypothetical protein
VGELAPIDMNGASADFTVTFPASPSHGDLFGYFLSRSHATYEAVINRNSSNVMGGTDVDPYLLYIAGEYLVWRYDSTSSGRGWQLEHDGRIPGQCKLNRTSIQTGGSFVHAQLNNAVINIGGLADTTNYRIYCRRDGRYQISGQAQLNTSTVAMLLNVAKNGNTSSQRFMQSLAAINSAIGAVQADISEMASLDAGDYITLLVHASSGTPDIAASDVFDYPSLTLHEVL